MRKMSILSSKAFSLLELMVVLIIVGILSTIAVVQFSGPKENALEKEAKANLKLIAAAEKIYRMEVGRYIDAADETQINQRLRLMIPTSANKAWDYSVGPGSTTTTFDARAVRTPSGPAKTLTIDEAEEEAH